MNYTKQDKRSQSERAEAWRRRGGGGTRLVRLVVDGVEVAVAISSDGRRRVVGPVRPPETTLQ